MQSQQEQSAPTGFWEERTGWTMLKQILFLEPLPGGSRWAAAFGSLLLFAFLLQVVTGVLLTMSYAPSVETAWPSVKYIQEEAPLGSFIRGLHHWGSSAMVILLLVHLIQVFVWGAYKKPREFTWMVGVLLLFCTLGLAFTGYLLPWDQKAYWATKVGLGIMSTTPGIGDSLRTLLQGGPNMGNLTLTRFFTVHAFLLPGLLIFLVVVHLYLFRRHGVTPGWWQSPAVLKAQEEPFWPKQFLKDAALALIFLVGLGLWAWHWAAPLEAQADPSQAYQARPEWYFMFLFRLLRYFEGPYEIVGTFVLPTLFFLILFFWPFLDRNPHRDPRRRPLAMTLLGGSTVGLVGLTIFAIATDVRMKEPAIAQAPSPARKPEPAGPIQRADVAKIYNGNCAACHGIDGTGQQIRKGLPTIPDFTSLAWQMSQTDLEINHRIVDGNEPLMPAYRDKLSQGEILALTVYVRAFVGASPASPVATPPGRPAPKAERPAPTAAQMSPSQIYRAYCLACHDADGRGQTARKAMPDLPDFTQERWQTDRKDADLKKSILEGKGKFMLPMKDKLNEADADQMVAFVRTFRTGKQLILVQPQMPVVQPSPAQPTVVPDRKTQAHPPVASTPGADRAPSGDVVARTRAATGLYRQYCLICHGINGNGSEMRAAMPSIPDFTSRAWQTGSSTPQLLNSILDGKGTLMPPFRGRVNEEQARDLAAYVRAFGPASAAPSEVPTGDFERRFRELQDQWNELQKQLESLPPSQPKANRPG
ncbi:MAG TPA: cytochrome b N-terminal domain-containing protein [Gemmataceae bacterium]|nr:cytochrome b N-terminal domain-containing protein [Gemmataceae bacterium]